MKSEETQTQTNEEEQEKNPIECKSSSRFAVQ